METQPLGDCPLFPTELLLLILSFVLHHAFHPLSSHEKQEEWALKLDRVYRQTQQQRVGLVCRHWRELVRRHFATSRHIDSGHSEDWQRKVAGLPDNNPFLTDLCLSIGIQNLTEEHLSRFPRFPATLTTFKFIGSGKEDRLDLLIDRLGDTDHPALCLLEVRNWNNDGRFIQHLCASPLSHTLTSLSLTLKR